jgi:hypothetical protein
LRGAGVSGSGGGETGRSEGGEFRRSCAITSRLLIPPTHTFQAASIFIPSSLTSSSSIHDHLPCDIYTTQAFALLYYIHRPRLRPRPHHQHHQLAICAHVSQFISGSSFVFLSTNDRPATRGRGRRPCTCSFTPSFESLPFTMLLRCCYIMLPRIRRRLLAFCLIGLWCWCFVVDARAAVGRVGVLL